VEKASGGKRLILFYEKENRGPEGVTEPEEGRGGTIIDANYQRLREAKTLRPFE